jgi:hypothetical protein
MSLDDYFALFDDFSTPSEPSAQGECCSTSRNSCSVSSEDGLDLDLPVDFGWTEYDYRAFPYSYVDSDQR